MNEETGIREKDGEAFNLTFIYDTAQDSLVSSYATLLKSQLEKVGINLELKGSEKMEWYAEMMAGNFDITYWIGEYEFSSPHCFFGAMPALPPHPPQTPHPMWSPLTSIICLNSGAGFLSVII